MRTVCHRHIPHYLNRLLLLVLLFALAPWGNCADLRAGAAESVITPEVAGKVVYLAGFGHNRTATGVHDDLSVRCLALQVSGKTLVLCAADLIGLFHQDVLAIRERFQSQAPSHSFLIVACTHTHAGPDTLGLWGPTEQKSGVDTAYLEHVKTVIAETALHAVAALRPARMDLSRNEDPMLGELQSVDRPPYVKDPYLFVMRLRAANGETIATLLNFSDHPEVMGRANRAITADYPHWVREYLERDYGGIAIFVSGSIGKVSALGEDVVLRDPKTGVAAPEGTWLKAELLGARLAGFAADALKSAESAQPDSIALRAVRVFVPLHNERFRLAEALGIFSNRVPLYTGSRPDSNFQRTRIEGVGEVNVPRGQDLASEVDYVQLRVGKRVLAEIVTIPGEIYPELVNGGITRYPGADYPDAPLEPALRPQLKSQYQFVLGLANDEIGYLIPKAEWDEVPPWLQDRPKPWYGEINSTGPDAAGVILRALIGLIEGR
jgi:hypothetical protein